MGGEGVATNRAYLKASNAPVGVALRALRPAARSSVALIPSLGVIWCSWPTRPSLPLSVHFAARSMDHVAFRIFRPRLQSLLSLPPLESRTIPSLTSGGRHTDTGEREKVAPSSTGESPFPSFISSHALHASPIAALPANPANHLDSVSTRRHPRHPSVSTAPTGVPNSTNPQ